MALNNIKYRANVNSMNPMENNVDSLEGFIKLTKASRYHFCLKEEAYTGFLDVVVNAKLRTAIGHNDVEYDSAKQLITYIPNPKDRANWPKKIGRNELCPCGSGKKYKRCHGR